MWAIGFWCFMFDGGGISGVHIRPVYCMPFGVPESVSLSGDPKPQGKARPHGDVYALQQTSSEPHLSGAFLAPTETPLCVKLRTYPLPFGERTRDCSPGQNTGVGSLSLFQGIFPTQRLNPHQAAWMSLLWDPQCAILPALISCKCMA